MPVLHVITAVFNTANLASRRQLYLDFSERMVKRGVVFHTAELAIGDQAFAFTNAADPQHTQFRATDALWYKENLVNAAIKKLPPDWEYVAWVDADMQFARPDWPQETIANLQKHPFVQMFSHMVDLGPRYRAISVRPGFAANLTVVRDLVLAGKRIAAMNEGLPGLAWAGRRKEIEALGGLLDWDIVGGNDTYMAMAMAGLLTGPAPAGLKLPPYFADSVFEWQNKCATIVRDNIGYNEDLALHYWHGRRAGRGYQSRTTILLDNAFNPKTDLSRDADGILRLAGNKPALRHQLEQYFAVRDDSLADAARSDDAQATAGPSEIVSSGFATDPR